MGQAATKVRTEETLHDASAAQALALRKAFGNFATGVTVVTAQTPEGPIGMTANSFSSLSLDPPLVLWSAAKSSSRHKSFVEAEHFCINILSAEQANICKRFAKSGRDFNELDWSAGCNGAPLIHNALTQFECERYAIHDAGDHSLIIGRIVNFEVNPGEVLCFSQGRFGTFTAST